MAQGHEDRVDLAQDLRGFALEDPSVLRLVVGVEDAQTARSVGLAFLLTLDAVVVTGVLKTLFVEVVGVEDQLPVLGKDAPESGPILALGVGIDDIDDMSVARRHHVEHLGSRIWS